MRRVLVAPRLKVNGFTTSSYPSTDPLVASLKNIEGFVYSTNFAWGDYEIGPFE